MDIKTYTVTELKDAISDGSLWKYKNHAITLSRANSQVANPRARESDVVLVVALKDEELLGYIGVLPDYIYVKGKSERFGWLSTFWVDPSQRGRGIGKSLVSRAFESWEGSIGGVDYTVSAKRVYDSVDYFIPLHHWDGTALTLRLRGELSRARFIRYLMIGPIEKAAEFTINKIMDIRLKIWKKAKDRKREVRIEYIDTIDDETGDFIEKQRKDPMFHRGKKELNWIIEQPWVVSAPSSDATDAKYDFSSSAQSFGTANMRISDTSGKTLAFVMLTDRDGVVKVPYYYCVSSEIEVVCHSIGRYLVARGCSKILLYNPELAEAFDRSGIPRLRKSVAAKDAFISKKYGELSFDKVQIQDGEGDCAFT